MLVKYSNLDSPCEELPWYAEVAANGIIMCMQGMTLMGWFCGYADA